MNLFGRAGRSVSRKPVKSILLFLVVFIISIFLLSGMASKSASVKTQDNTRQAVGAGFVLEPNDAYRKNLLNELAGQLDGEGSIGGYHQKQIVVNNELTWMTWTDNSFESIDLKDIEKIAENSGICDYNITTATEPVNPVNFTRIEEADVDQSGDMLGVSLIGNRDMQMDINVLTGNLSVTEGRMIGRDDKNACVVSEEIAKLNHLKIGDKLRFNDYHDREDPQVYEAEVIGIYEVKQKMSPLMSGDTFRSENVIFTDLRFPEKPAGDGEPAYMKAYFKVGDAAAYDDVKEQVKQTDINWEEYDFIDNNGNYDTMSSNFNELEHISGILLWVVAAASFLILFLVFVFWQKSRMQEIGIFLSMGVPKTEIIAQILLEGLFVAIIAVVISFAVAPKVSSLTAEYLVGQQVQQEQEKKEMEAGNVSLGGAAQSEEKVNGVSVCITPQMMTFDGMAIAVLVSLSVITSGILIVIKKPKSILSEMS